MLLVAAEVSGAATWRRQSLAFFEEKGGVGERSEPGEGCFNPHPPWGGFGEHWRTGEGVSGAWRAAIWRRKAVLFPQFEHVSTELDEPGEQPALAHSSLQ